MPQVELQDLQARVYARLDGNTQLYSLTSVNSRINEGARCLNLFTGFSQATVLAGLTIANWQWYRVPAPIVFPMKVYCENRELNKSSVSSTSDVSPRWLRGSTNQQIRSWIPVGTTMFAIVDVDPTGGKALSVMGVTTPALLVNETDTLNLDDEYADLIVDYAFVNLVLKEGGKPFADASSNYKGWLKRVRALQRWEKKINPSWMVEIESATEVPAA